MAKILLIEDDMELARGILYVLEREKFSMQQAFTLSEGKQKLTEQPFDLILLDVMLPDGNGYDFCREINSSKPVPVIFLTACSEEVNIVMGLDLGADDYITKPFKIRELVSRIKAVLRRTGPGAVQNAPSSAVCSGEVRADLIEHRLFKGDREIILTPTEFRLLSTFLQNPMKNLGRNQILSRLWDIEGEFIDDSTLSVYIRRLREKLEEDPSRPRYLVTVRGVGYRWNQGSVFYEQDAFSQQGI